MSFSRISTLALALAAGLAAPASAATYNVSFLFGGSNVGSGTFTVADGTSLPGPVATFSFSLSLPGEEGVIFDYSFSGDGTTDLLFKPKFGFNGPGGAAALAGNNINANGNGALLSFGVLGGWGVTSLVGNDCQVELPGEDEIQTFDAPICFDQWTGTYSITGSEVPEEPSVIPLPAAAALLPLGLVALGAFRLRKTG